MASPQRKVHGSLSIWKHELWLILPTRLDHEAMKIMNDIIDINYNPKIASM
jgi:hypothetical protein